MSDMTSPDYQRGVDDALAEVERRLDVADQQGDFLTYPSMRETLREAAQRLRAGAQQEGQ